MKQKHIDRYRRQLKHIDSDQYPAMYRMIELIIKKHDEKKK